MVVLGPGNGQNQTVELNSRPMQLPQLGDALTAALRNRPDKTVYLKASREKSYGDVMAAIDEIKGAGASPIGLQIDYLQ